ncbi:MAG: rod shape-determining protein MreC [Acidobacteriaceae bacterium]
MESFLSRYRNPLVLLAVVLAQLLGLAVQVRRPATGKDGHETRLVRYWVVGAISPFEQAFLAVGHGISHTWNNYLDLRHVRQQNQQLQAELDRMRLEQSSLAVDARLGLRLQKLFEFQQHYIAKTVAAHVIGTSGTDLSRLLLIDKGSRDGLHTDMPVITPDGVVGKVRDVFPHTAQVLEINDETSGLGIVLTKTRLRGILRGNAAGQTEIIDILPDERIQPGEQVVTSGGDSVYPSGLPVGTVERVVNDPEHNPYVAVLVRPAVSLSRLDEVLVITQTQNTMPASMQQDIATSEEKAADILAQRLPSVPPPPTVGPDGKPINANSPPPPVRPPASLHPDQFTPDATPPAVDLTPGAAYPNHVFPAQPPPAAAVHPRTEAQPGTATSGATTLPAKPVTSSSKTAATQPTHHSQTSSQRPKTTQPSPAATPSRATQPGQTDQEPQN